MATPLKISNNIYQRNVLENADVYLKNRFYEENPVLSAAGSAVIARPGMKKFMEVGVGPIRKVFSELGTFSDSLFVVSGSDLYKVDTAGVDTLIGTISSSPLNGIDMAVAANIGTTVPERLFISEGGVLWVYVENGQALGLLTASGAPANNDTVTIDGIVYKFTTGSVDTGTPAGTAGNPWLVARTGVQATDLQHLFDAINDTGTGGTDYSTALTPHTTVTAYNVTNNTLAVTAVDYGIAGNALATTEASANLSWGAATLQDGGDNMLRQVPTPNGEGAISIAHINGYIIVIPSQGAGVNGRFYWVAPGEITIDPLNFATAERAPDAVNQVVVYSDMFWLCGQTSLEPWITTTDPDFPMERFRGVLYDRGCWEGTALRIKEALFLCDDNGAVFKIAGGLKRISTPDIEELIRRAIQAQSLLT